MELFENEVQDQWELNDDEYLSKRELQEAHDREKKMQKNDNNDISKEDDKRWLDVDRPAGNSICMHCTILIYCMT